MDGGNPVNAGAINRGPPWMAEILKLQEQFSGELGNRG
jgi:hypothetical protein